MGKLEEGDNAMWRKLLKEIEDKGILFDLTMDFGPCGDYNSFFGHAQGYCTILTQALVDEGLINDYEVMTGEGVIIDYEEWEDRRHLTLKYVKSCDFRLNGTTAGINRVYAPKGVNLTDTQKAYYSETEYYNIIKHETDVELPDFVTNFSPYPLIYKIPKEFNRDLESILKAKYPTLFRLLNDTFQSKQTSLYIEYFGPKSY